MAQKPILNKTIQTIISHYKKILKNNGIAIEQIILFGSYAKGNPKPWSDLDICVVSKQFGKDYYNEGVKLQQLTFYCNPTIEPHPYHPKDLTDPFDPLAYEINKTGKVIQ